VVPFYCFVHRSQNTATGTDEKHVAALSDPYIHPLRQAGQDFARRAQTTPDDPPQRQNQMPTMRARIANGFRLRLLDWVPIFPRPFSVERPRPHVESYIHRKIPEVEEDIGKILSGNLFIASLVGGPQWVQLLGSSVGMCFPTPLLAKVEVRFFAPNAAGNPGAVQ
jgi:hypothetical protein